MIKTYIFVLLVTFNSFLLADGILPVGSGTASDPYQVNTLDNILWMSTHDEARYGHYIQTADIDASESVEWNDGQGLWPLLLQNGSYNGMGFTISNLCMEREYGSLGLFGSITNSTLEDINLQNVIISGYHNVGSLVGQSTNSRIINCIAEDVMIVGIMRVGGLVGEFRSLEENNNALIMNSAAIGDITGGLGVGGLIGISDYADIYYCFAATDSIVGSTKVGGLIGLAEHSLLANNEAITTLICSEYGGGLVGCIDDVEINNCCSDGYLEGTDIGGLIGLSWTADIQNCYSTAITYGAYSAGFISNATNQTIVKKCYSTGYTNGDGFINNCSADCYNNFWDKETTDDFLGGISDDGATGKSTEEMKSIQTYTDTTLVGLSSPWDFTSNPFMDSEDNDYWEIDGVTNEGYPFFANEYVENDDVVSYNEYKVVKLLGNSPNPFYSEKSNSGRNTRTMIQFELFEDSNIKLVIYNVKGQKIRTLVDCFYKKGKYGEFWNGKDYQNNNLSSGVYFYTVSTNGKLSDTKKCLLLN